MGIPARNALHWVSDKSCILPSIHPLRTPENRNMPSSDPSRSNLELITIPFQMQRRDMIAYTCCKDFVNESDHRNDSPSTTPYTSLHVPHGVLRLVPRRSTKATTKNKRRLDRKKRSQPHRRMDRPRRSFPYVPTNASTFRSGFHVRNVRHTFRFHHAYSFRHRLRLDNTSFFVHTFRTNPNGTFTKTFDWDGIRRMFSSKDGRRRIAYVQDIHLHLHDGSQQGKDQR